ncbi:hypothetical protein M9Y10_042872 [Tritrichomonas musculus]|uniref:BRCT domain-containing protein n=1 Tax=Tritrichomonas musculus TaxID=1915356 RepID=A0ABR2JZ38_9EUKA
MSRRSRNVQRVLKHRAEEDATIENYWETREKKLEAQMQKAETSIFKNCVFYILGYVGRGEGSRYRLSKIIEQNGGRNEIMVTSRTTHIISRSICHSKRHNLDKSIERRHVVIVGPEYIFECIKQGKLIEPTPFITVKQKATLVTKYFEIENKEDKSNE